LKDVKRYVDTREWVGSFVDEILVICPRCQRCATARNAKPMYSNAGKIDLVCPDCGLARKAIGVDLPGYRRSTPSELKLWLQTPCCGDILWALNARQLETIKSYVEANLREQHKHPEYGWHNNSFVSRLPKWIQKANHREEVLKCVERLEQKLPNMS